MSRNPGKIGMEQGNSYLKLLLSFHLMFLACSGKIKFQPCGTYQLILTLLLSLYYFLLHAIAHGLW